MTTVNHWFARHHASHGAAVSYRTGALGALLTSAAVALAGCAAHSSAGGAGGRPAVAAALVRFTDCTQALHALRAAASRAAAGSGVRAAGPGESGTGAQPGFPAKTADAGSASAPSADGAAAPSAAAAAPPLGTGGLGAYSGTNTAEAGVDEPDLIKTDGRRIVTVSGGVLRVVDAETRQLTGVLDLLGGQADPGGPGLASLAPASLLLAGDHALVLFAEYPAGLAEGTKVPAAGAAGGTVHPGAEPIAGPRLIMVDLSTATPRVTSEYAIDGALVDARQVGVTVRVVVHSTPRLFVMPGGASGEPGPQQPAETQTAIAHAPVDTWLPRYELTTGGAQRTGHVDCAAMSAPASHAYSGSSMLTVLTFDLSRATLDDGQPVTIVADGETVYSNGHSLYVASDQGSPLGAQLPAEAGSVSPAPAAGRTDLYKFDIAQPGQPQYAASGSVPGWLVNQSATAQYALSEWHGALRVATTTTVYDGGIEPQRQSSVYVLEQTGASLRTVGQVGGLGNGEQIYAVRFAGPVGYVVTFRQTDPLYTLDLSDPSRPSVAGELLLRGYSAYLDPIDGTHLIGVGQDATQQGQTQGTQVCLFDVSDLAAPVRLAVYRVLYGHSEAEFDPHAFLYWPASGTLVIPVQTFSALPVRGGAAGGPMTELMPASEAVVLEVGDHTVTRLGAITHPVVPGAGGSQIRRSLVIGATLWTVSDAGLKASSLTTLAPLGWVPFS